MENTKKQYETTFIVNGSLEDPQVESIITQATETITRNGGEIIALNKWGRKRLAYPIKKKNNGYYVNVEFVGMGIIIPLLERVLTLDENVLRYLSIQLDEKILEARKQPHPTPLTEVVPDVDDIVREPLFEDDEEVSIPEV